MSIRSNGEWQTPDAVCDGCGERLVPFTDRVVIAYVLDAYTNPILDSPCHYHLHCAASHQRPESENQQ